MLFRSIYLSNMKDLKGAPIQDVQINNLLDNMATLSNWMVAKSIGNDTARYMGELGKSLGIAERVGSMEGGEKGQVIKVYDRGQEKFYAFHDPAFIPAFKGNEIVLGSLVKLLSAPARLTRRAITVANVFFPLTQLPQDAMRAFVEGGLKNPWAIFPKVLTNFTKELLNPSDTSIRLMEYGIKGRGSDIIAGEAKRTFRRRLGYYDSSIAGYGEKGWDFLERIQSASDAAIRSALYDLTMKETGGVKSGENWVGGNEVLALKRAREIINFDTQGSSQISTFLRSTVPFMGVQIISLPIAGLTIGSFGISLVATVFITVLVMNAVNFIDGLNGLASGVVYDALHLAVAERSGCGRLYTYNIRDFERLAPKRRGGGVIEVDGGGCGGG